MSRGRSSVSRVRAWAPHVLALILLAGYHTWQIGSHFWLCDDAFISFRYVRNLVDGYGLVWNVGERVEGYTNFAWCLELAGILGLTGIAPEDAAPWLSLAYTAGTFVVTAALASSTPFVEQRRMAITLAVGFLCLHRSFAVWATSGLETRQFTFFVVLTCWLLRRPGGRLRYVPASLALAAASLTRPEGLLLFAMSSVWLVLAHLRTRPRPWRELLGFALPFVAVACAHTLFRIGYYGDPLPNTYYAKNVRPWFEAGGAYFVQAAIETGLYVVLPLALLGLVARVRRTADLQHVLSAVLVLPHAYYIARIGGDHFEFRMLDSWWPLLAVACADGIIACGHAAADVFARRLRLAQLAFVVASTLVTGAVVAYGMLPQVAHDQRTASLRGRDETFGLVVPLDTHVVPWLRFIPLLDRLLPVYNHAQRFCSHHSVATRWLEHREFWRQQMQRYGALIRHGGGSRHFPPTTVSAEGTIGVFGYALRPITVIDTLGLTDRVVAHNPDVPANELRQLAHDRRPPPGYLDQRGLNLHVLGSERSLRDALTAHGHVHFALRVADDAWFPLDIHDLMWARRTFHGRPLFGARLSAKGSGDVVFDGGVASRTRLPLADFEDPPVDAEGFFWRASDGGDGIAGAAAACSARALTARWRSRSFIAQRGDSLLWLVAGEPHPSAVVEVRCGGVTLASRHPEGWDFSLVSVALAGHEGQSCEVEARTTETTMCLDHVLVMTTEP